MEASGSAGHCCLEKTGSAASDTSEDSIIENNRPYIPDGKVVSHGLKAGVNGFANDSWRFIPKWNTRAELMVIRLLR